jgi:ParB family chromosome partitioning protein
MDRIETAAGGHEEAIAARAAEADVGTDLRQQDLADALGLRVGLTDRGGRGELTLSYASLEQLDDLCRRLMKA